MKQHKLTFLAVLFSIFSGPIIAGECFYVHLKDAIQINRSRQPRYRKLSNGLSSKVSSSLIWYERASLPFAFLLEQWAKIYWRHEIPILCADFISMKETPEFKESYDTPPPQDARFVKPPVGKWIRDIRRAYKTNGFLAAHVATLAAMETLEHSPHFYSLTRHTLESLARLLFLAPQYEKLAKEKNSYSTRFLSSLMMRAHFWTLRFGAYLDRLAFPVQKMGIPIIHQDVPKIPTKPVLRQDLVDCSDHLSS